MRMRKIRGASCLVLTALALLNVLNGCTYKLSETPFRGPERGFAVSDGGNIVLFGDSITANGEYGQLMQNLIDERFPDRDIRVLSRGSHGDTAHGAHRRIERDIATWDPALVLLNFGINDRRKYTPEEFLYHYEHLVNAIAQRTGGVEMGIVSPIYPDADGEKARLEKYVTGLKDLAKEYDLHYIPVYEETKRLRPTLPENVRYAPDSLHPNKLGTWMFAQAILAELRFPFKNTPLKVEEPARRVTKNKGKQLSGTRFTLDLPRPVKVTLTAPSLPNTTVHHVEESPDIDGKLDDWEDDWPMFLGTREQRIWGVVQWDRPHVEAQMNAAWNKQGLYLAIDVVDPFIRHAEDRPNIVSRDAVEICLDLRKPDVRAKNPHINFNSDTKNVCQYVLAPAGHEVSEAVAELGNGDKKMLEGIKVASGRTKMGYALEFFVPARHFPDQKLTADMEIGFDAAVIDVMHQDNYLSATEFRWSGSPWSAFSTREFGTMQFVRAE